MPKLKSTNVARNQNPSGSVYAQHNKKMLLLKEIPFKKFLLAIVGADSFSSLSLTAEKLGWSKKTLQNFFAQTKVNYTMLTELMKNYRIDQIKKTLGKAYLAPLSEKTRSLIEAMLDLSLRKHLTSSSAKRKQIICSKISDDSEDEDSSEDSSEYNSEDSNEDSSEYNSEDSNEDSSEYNSEDSNEESKEDSSKYNSEESKEANSEDNRIVTMPEAEIDQDMFFNDLEELDLFEEPLSAPPALNTGYTFSNALPGWEFTSANILPDFCKFSDESRNPCVTNHSSGLQSQGFFNGSNKKERVAAEPEHPQKADSYHL